MPIVPESLILDNPSIDRSDALAGLRIILLHKNHGQYIPIIRRCGAEAIEAFAFSTTSLKSALKSIFDHPDGKESSYVLKDDLTSKADPLVKNSSDVKAFIWSSVA